MMNKELVYMVICGITGDIKYYTTTKPKDCLSVWDVPSGSFLDYWTIDDTPLILLEGEATEQD